MEKGKIEGGLEGKSQSTLEVEEEMMVEAFIPPSYECQISLLLREKRAYEEKRKKKKRHPKTIALD